MHNLCNFQNDKPLLKSFLDMASGKIEADLIIENAKIVNVFTNEIYTDKDLVIGNGIILGIVEKGLAKAKNKIDANNSFLLPGFIDAHVHIESSMLSPRNFAALALTNGTTTIVADPHEIANVLGLEGIKYMMNEIKAMPINSYFMLPSCVPATPFENAGAVLDANELQKLISENNILGLGEMMNFPGVVHADNNVMDKLILAHSHNKVIDGHSPMLKGQELDAYVGSGISTDHECTTIEEMHERLARGMYILIRQGSSARDAEILLKGVNQHNANRCCFCCDDISAMEMLEDGHMQRHLRLAVKLGINPIDAIRMLTINTATCYNLKNIGAIAPGYKADFVLVDNLTDFNVQSVYASGTRVAQNKEYLLEIPPSEQNNLVEKAINIAPISLSNFALKASGKCKVIGIIPNSLVTKSLVMDIKSDENGFFDYKQNPDITKIAVVERHKATGNIGLGLLHGYIQENEKLNGAIASSASHDSHNIVVVGDSDSDMLLAVQTLEKHGGGIVLVQEGKVTQILELPIAGLMSYSVPKEVSKKKQSLHNFPYSKNIEPLVLLSFLALSVIPELKITDQGLFDVLSFSFTSIQAD